MKTQNRANQDLEEILEHVPAVVFRLSKEENGWRTWYVNNTITTYGYTTTEFMDGAIQWFDIVHPDDKTVLVQTINDYESRKIDEFRLYYRIITKSGDSVPITEYNTANRDSNGQVYCYDTVILSNSQSESGQLLIKDYYKQQLVLNDILMSLHDSDLDNAIRITLDRTGVYLDTSRVLLFKDAPDKKTCRVVYEWCNKGIPSYKAMNDVISYTTDIPEVYKAMESTGVMLVNYSEIPENSAGEFEKEEVIAAAIFAVYLYGQRYGFICFDDCIIKRKWDQDTARFLKNISNLISTVLVRQRAADQLEVSRKTCEAVLDNIDSYIFAEHLGSGEIIFANRAFRQAFGTDCIGKPGMDYFPAASGAGNPSPAYSFINKPSSGNKIYETYCGKTDEWLAVDEEIIPWIDGQMVRLVTCYDMTAKKLYADAIERQAFLDHLTGLPNRFRCDVDLQEAMEQSAISGKSGCVFL
ncbi:PAS domain-containing protein [Brucepastera parasyntrophica]|uniref:sensor domain-containing diguanylate cyclase n=1 Tax=Brucepastera parasyntrophica TaxID=2880008 RepID=UPI00210D7140|nr:PAS domain-containing protein [Brucepastera parasyntrophica]ULQ60851.1 PAS domain-containing protein [Brucepastera parasyntrophica]